MRRGAFVLLFLLGACGGGDDIQESCPDPNSSCTAGDETCTTADERCTCSFASWKCEPVACPEGQEMLGAACEEAGLLCAGLYGESPGNRCVGPEMVWVGCAYYYQDDGIGSRSSCPPEPPTLGAPCCQAYGVGGAPLGCRYDTTVIDCVEGHWAQIE